MYTCVEIHAHFLQFLIELLDRVVVDLLEKRVRVYLRLHGVLNQAVTFSVKSILGMEFVSDQKYFE